MNLPETIKIVQRIVGVEDDGIAGPKTWHAILQRLASTSGPIDNAVDARSEKNIATLAPEVAPYARALVHEAAEAGIEIKVISGTRTYDEQDDLYEQGRSKPGRIVTNARGGFSNHNHGIAFDIGVFKNGQYVEESPAYAAVGAIGKRIGLSWGGDWTSIEDTPHFELRPRWAKSLSEKEMLAELRRRKDAGMGVFA